jgi:hypothetical protein
MPGPRSAATSRAVGGHLIDVARFDGFLPPSAAGPSNLAEPSEAPSLLETAKRSRSAAAPRGSDLSRHEGGNAGHGGQAC